MHYNVIVRSVRVTIAAVEKKYILVCVCGGGGERLLGRVVSWACACTCALAASLNQHANFSEFSHKRHDFRKNLLNIKCVF
jgi:hypothetical protein